MQTLSVPSRIKTARRAAVDELMNKMIIVIASVTLAVKK
jgi:hypothetical protein